MKTLLLKSVIVAALMSTLSACVVAPAAPVRYYSAGVPVVHPVPTVVAPAPVYVQPAPVYVAPPPVVYLRAPAPVFYPSYTVRSRIYY